MQKEILKHLKTIEKTYQVKILYAVESGSRAWGFSSLDSDYDVRFIYVRKKDDYLKLNPDSDVIEYMLNDTLDINGWDLQKALKLLYASNPTLLEWLFSPIVYYEVDLIKDLRELALKYCLKKTLVYHYLHIAKNHYKQYLENQSNIILKKYFYCIRPILCIEYIKENDSVPPVPFLDVIPYLPKDVYKIVIELLEHKKASLEELYIKPISALNTYLLIKMKEIESYVETLPSLRKPIEALDAFFLKVVNLDETQAS